MKKVNGQLIRTLENWKKIIHVIFQDQSTT